MNEEELKLAIYNIKSAIKKIALYCDDITQENFDEIMELIDE